MKKEDQILQEVRQINKKLSKKEIAKHNQAGKIDESFEPVKVSRSGSFWDWVCDKFRSFIAGVKLHRKRVAQKRQLLRLLSDKHLNYLFKKYISGSETKSVPVDSKDGTGIQWKQVPLTTNDKRAKLFRKVKLDDLIIEVNKFKTKK